MATPRAVSAPRATGSIADRPSAPSPEAVAMAGLLALAVAMGIGRFAFTPLLPMMQRDEGLSLAQGAWLAAANYAGYLLGALSAMRVPIRAPVAIRAALVAIGVATLGMGLTHQLLTWVALRLVAGVASAWALVFASAWSLERLAVAGRPLLSGRVFAGVGTGIAIAGALCLAAMRAGENAAHAWLAIGALALTATASIWRVLAPGARRPLRPGARDETALSWDADAARLVACYGAFGFGYIIPGTFLPVMARQAIRDPLIFGWAWPLFGAAAAITPLLAAAPTRRLGNRRVWMLSHVAMAIGVLLPAWSPGIPSVMAAAVVVGATFMVITLTAMQEARAMAGARATRLMAAMTAAFAVGQILGPVCASYLADGDGRFGRALLLASAVLLASAWLLRQRRTREAIG